MRQFTQISVTMSDALIAEINEACKKHGLNRSQLLRMAVSRYLERLKRRPPNQYEAE